MTREHPGDLIETFCAECYITFAIPRCLDEAMKADSEVCCYCPMGHEGYYVPESPSRDDLQQQLANLRRKHNALIAQRDQNEAGERGAA